MIKPPSNQKTYDAFYSGDPAIIQLPDEASDEQKKDRDDRIKRARETGLWDDVIAGGEQPTVFTFKQLTAAQTGHLHDIMGNPRRQFEALMLAFCLALVDVKHLGEAGKPTFVNAELGRMATTQFLDKAGCTGELGAAIIVELGSYVLERARAANPKS